MFTNKKEEHLKDFFRERVENCPKCKGQDPVCECRDAYSNEYKFLKAGIPIEHINFELDTLQFPGVEKMKDATEIYIKNLKANISDGFGLFLHGGHGTGKTTLGCIALKAAIRQKYSAAFLTLEDCKRVATANWGGAGEFPYEIQDKIENSDLLLIDDIGGLEIKTSSTKELVISTFTNVFRHRSNNKQSTIVTSNFSPKELYDVFGSHVYSSLMQYQKFVDFPSEADFRQTTLSPQRNDEKKVKRNERRKGTGYQL